MEGYKMQTRMRKLIISLLTITMLFGLALTVSAASFEDAKLDNKTSKGSVNISKNGASAQTSINARPEDSSTIVTLTYSYINTKTNKITTIKKTEIGRSVANASIRKPNQTYYISLEATASHNVTYAGQKWATRSDKKMATIPLIPLLKTSKHFTYGG